MTPAEPTENVDTTGGASTLVEGKAKKKGLLGNKVETVPPYDVVPSMRPVVIIGPSLKVIYIYLRYFWSNKENCFLNCGMRPLNG